jgi:hypothetical protein
VFGSGFHLAANLAWASDGFRHSQWRFAMKDAKGHGSDPRNGAQTIATGGNGRTH